MGLFKAFTKGLFGSSPEKVVADIMNLYFTARGRGYDNEESTSFVIKSRYPYSEFKRNWIKTVFETKHYIEQSDEEGALKELVFVIWWLEMVDSKSSPWDVPSLSTIRIEAMGMQDPLTRLTNDIDKVYYYLTAK
jgi:hypothetical protein